MSKYTKIMFKYTREELQKLKSLEDELRSLEQRNVYPLTEELLEQLANMVKSYNDHNDLFTPDYSFACGCLGPRDNQLYCPCAMGSCRYEYRYDIALYLFDQLLLIEVPIG
jgi:hypothetical protein